MKNKASIFYYLLLSGFLFIGCTGNSTAGSAESKTTETQVSTPTINHSAWNKLLQAHVNDKGEVNYKNFASDRKAVQAYINYLSKINPAKYSKKEQLAYWVNAYNVLTVDLIIRNYPLKSIMNLAGGKVWDQKLPYKFNGESLSLSEIENEKLLKQLFDARIHFVINCASVSCPKLLNKAFTAANIDALMESTTKGYINDPSQNKISDSKASLSMIFNWYKSDFIKASGSVEKFINKYSATKINSNNKIEYLDYNWNLNGK